MKHIVCALAALLALSFAIGAPRGQEQYEPSDTKVALMPVMNASGEEWKDLLAKQSERGDSYLREQFGGRGFQIVPPEKVKAAIEALKLDLLDEEQHKRSNFLEVGKAVEADLVVFAVITDTSQKLTEQLLSSKREGRAKVKLWLLDVRKEEPIVSAKSVEGKSGGGFFAGLDKGSDRQVIAVANALRDGLKDFFKKYPELPGAKKK